MRRGFAAVAGLAGILTAFFLRRRRESAASLPGPDPAEELRRKLAASRAEPAPVEPPAAPDADARRRDVHAEARAAIEEMRGHTEE